MDFNNNELVEAYKKYPLVHKALGKPAFLDFVGKVTGLNILDLGCGTGHIAKALSERGANVVGVDQSDLFLKEARTTYPDLRFELAQASSLTMFSDAEFDMIIMVMVILCIDSVEELQAVFSECARTVKPGGVLAFSTLHPFNTRNFFDSARDVKLPADGFYFASGMRFTNVAVLPDQSSITFENIHWTLEDMSTVMENAGFQISQLREPRLPEDSPYFNSLRGLSETPYYLFFKAIRRQ